MKKIFLIIAVITVILSLGGLGYYLLAGTNDVTMARRAFEGRGAVTCTYGRYADPRTGDHVCPLQ